MAQSILSLQHPTRPLHEGSARDATAMNAMPHTSAPDSGLVSLTIVIGLEGAQSPSVRLVIAEEAILGRADDEDGFRPDLDLEPFGGRDAGVSRRHARISRRRGALFLADLGSVNGTRVNGHALEPDQAFRLRDGDCVELGHLTLCVYLGDS